MEEKVIATNKKILRDFEIIDKLEVGIELKGFEVKSIREGKVSLDGAYVKESNNEFYIYKMFIQLPPSLHANTSEKRRRKLLLHKNEIIRWSTKVKEKGLTILPLDIHTNNNRIKLTIALVRKKKLYGNKKKIEEKIAKREMRNL